MGESFRSRLRRYAFNFFPAYRGTGGRVTYIADDFKTIRIKVPLNWRTRNYVGSIYGGSMYGAIDPMYMIMFIKLLGPKYIVWDKAATIRFKKPGRSTLTAQFTVDDAELDSIRSELEQKEKIDRVYTVDLLDMDKVICASFEKTIHFSKK